MQLIEPITRAEVQVALQDIDSQKAPGCDGYNGVLFKKKHGPL